MDIIDLIKHTDWSKARALHLVPDIPIVLVFSRKYTIADTVKVYVNLNTQN